MDDDDDDDDERPIEEGGAGRRYGWPLFFLATVFGAVSWTTTAAVVLELKRSLGTSVASTVEIALFTTWATSLGASLSLVVELCCGASTRGVLARLGPATSEAPPFVALYLGYMLLQGCALLFVSATVVALDSSASMVLWSAALSAAYLGAAPTRNELAGLGLIAGALLVVGGAEEALGGGDDDGALASLSADASIGVGAAFAMGALYAGTNVLYERVLTARSDAVPALALNGVVCASCFLLLTGVAYPALGAAGVLDSGWAWLGAIRGTPGMAALFPAFVASKLLWYSLETLLVKDMGAIWTAISGVALIPLLWLTELVAHYAFDAFFGVSWTTPDSWCQLAALFALVLGAVIYYGLWVVVPEPEETVPAPSPKPAAEPLMGPSRVKYDARQRA